MHKKLIWKLFSLWSTMVCASTQIFYFCLYFRCLMEGWMCVCRCVLDWVSSCRRWTLVSVQRKSTAFCFSHSCGYSSLPSNAPNPHLKVQDSLCEISSNACIIRKNTFSCNCVAQVHSKPITRYQKLKRMLPVNKDMLCISGESWWNPEKMDNNTCCYLHLLCRLFDVVISGASQGPLAPCFRSLMQPILQVL